METKLKPKIQTHRHREQIGVCQGEGRGIWAKMVKKYKLPFIKQIRSGDLMRL